ncbi:MAG: hypothetical protein CME43_13490 [Haliea sp.]|uniref:NAD(P)/FAD-dependent oxidoreductase n=1 Tax=Haliea sp. TaxID=1932666 RepID=UPI000C4D6106|nr:NAD(P)/FAD-dependent oxidoreductase [Haliea sp.]MBM70476.1 hypothetical protein [Haliea sp.]|tara:strand:- start:70482 stop:72182 length:1701 start_codon:yes stop_codon:yes gene_type:complete
MNYDVAIVGGGPAGSTLGSLLKKYHPDLSVAIFEREQFPREHVGESQLPPIGKILAEMGCWDKVEAANFPIKIGATYRWGNSPDLWDFEFLPIKDFRDEPRPARFVGQRQQTAFQVDRARYDKILLDHAEELGCDVHYQCHATPVIEQPGEISALSLGDGRNVTASYYVDASGSAAALRRPLGVQVDVPTSLKNVAFWSYWENAEWAVEIGTGGTRVQVMSIGSGWIWFIPLSPTRTSIGLVCPAAYYKESGLSPETIYLESLPKDPRIAGLIRNARREEKVYGTKDWSFLAQQSAGKNWFLAGESVGFADPILAAGMTLAQTGARELAYIIPELLRDADKNNWLKQWYEHTQKKRIGQHIRFADFWYSSNGQFTDLQAYTSEIAKDAGLQMNPQKAFQWLGTGGFTNDTTGQAGIGGLDLAGLKQITQKFTRGAVNWQLNKYNRFKLNLRNATRGHAPLFENGRITVDASYTRGQKTLVLSGMYALVVEVLKTHKTAQSIYEALHHYFQQRRDLGAPLQLLVHHALQALEVLLLEGWVQGSVKPGLPYLKLETPEEGQIIHTNRD